MPSTLGTRLGLFAFSKSVKNLLRGLRRKILIEVVVYCHHRCIATCSLAFHLDDSELAVLGSITDPNAAQMLRDSVEDVGRPAKHAWCRCAYLNEVLPNGLTIEHRIESGHFIDSHWRKFQQLRNIVHDADTCPSLILPLPEVQKGYNCGFLVLGWVVGDDILGRASGSLG